VKTFVIEVTYRFEIEVDDRVDLDSVCWGLSRAFHDYTDGRYHFYAEVAQHGVQTTVENVAEMATSSTADGIARKYPGGFHLGWKLAEKMPRPKVRMRGDWVEGRCDANPSFVVSTGGTVVYRGGGDDLTGSAD